MKTSATPGKKKAQEAKGGKLSVKEASPDKSPNHYGPITRRLTCSNNPITLSSFKTLHSNMAFKMKRDFNNIQQSNQKKEQLLKELREDLKRLQFTRVREDKISAIIQEHETMMRRDSLQGDIQFMDQVQKVEEEAEEALTKSRGNASGSMEDEDRDSGLKGSNALSGSERVSKEQQDSANAAETKEGSQPKEQPINLNQGIADHTVQPSKLLRKEMTLIREIKESHMRYLGEVKDTHLLKYMTQRIEDDRNKFRTKINQLDPYFNFQDKIKPTLANIEAGKDQRQKIQENKIRQMKQQTREMKANMAATLKSKYNELADLQRMNKQAKLRMQKKKDPGAQVEGNSFKDTASVAQSQMMQSKKESLNQKSSIKEEKKDCELASNVDETNKNIQINLENCDQLHQFICNSLILMELHQCLKQKKNQLKDEQAYTEQVSHLKEFVHAKCKQKFDFYEKVAQYRVVLNQKQPKKQKETQSHKEQMRKMEFHNRSVLMFKDLQEQLEYLLLNPAQTEPSIDLDNYDSTAHMIFDNLWQDRKEKEGEKLKGITLGSKLLSAQRQKEIASMQIQKMHVFRGSIPKIRGSRMASSDKSQREQYTEQDEMNLEPAQLQSPIVTRKSIRSKSSNEDKKQNTNITMTEKKRKRKSVMGHVANKSSIEQQKLRTKRERDYRLLCDVKKGDQMIAQAYNRNQAQDAIFEIDCKELNKNITKVKSLIEIMRNELAWWEAKKNKILEEEASEEEANRPQQISQMQDNQMIQWAQERVERGGQNVKMFNLQRYRRENQLTRLQINPEYLIGHNQIDPYRVERLKEVSQKQKVLTEEVRAAKDQIRLQCWNNASLFAFRIYTLYDATDMDYPDEDIRVIVHRYLGMKPLEPLDLHPLVIGRKEAKMSPQQVVDELEKEQMARQLKPDELRKLNRYKKLIYGSQVAPEMPTQLNDSPLGQFLRQQLEDKLVFIHQKKIVIFLKDQIEQILKNDASNRKGNALTTDRDSYTLSQFKQNYKQTNNSNVHNFNAFKHDEADMQQEAMLAHAINIDEEKHIHEMYNANHIHKNSAKLARLLELQRLEELEKRKKFVIEPPKHKMRDEELIQLEVNRDKCSYSKLLTYNRQDQNFVQNFAKKVDNMAKDEALRIQQASGDGADVEVDARKVRCASTSLLRATQSSKQKDVKNTDQVTSRQEIFRERIKLKSPLKTFKVKFALQSGSPGRRQNKVQDNTDKCTLKRSNLVREGPAVRADLSFCQPNDSTSNSFRSDSSMRQAEGAVRPVGGILIKKMMKKKQMKKTTRRMMSTHQNMDELLERKCEKLQLGSQQSQNLNLNLNLDLPMSRNLVGLEKTRSMQIGQSILKNPKNRGGAGAGDLTSQKSAVNTDNNDLKHQLKMILQEKLPEMPQTGRNGQRAGKIPISNSYGQVSEETRPALEKILNELQPIDQMQSMNATPSTDRLNTNAWYLAASDEEYFDPVCKLKKISQTSSTRIETPTVKTDRGNPSANGTKLNQVLNDQIGKGVSRNGVESPLQSLKHLKMRQNPLSLNYKSVSSSSNLPPTVPKTPTIARSKGTPYMNLEMYKTQSTIDSSRNQKMENPRTLHQAQGQSWAMAASRPPLLPTRSSGLPSTSKIRIKKIKIPKLRENRELYNVFKEL